MAHVFNTQTGEVIRYVKNLSWLLRHWKEIERFEYTCYSSPDFPRSEGVMTAYCKDGKTAYRTEWASNQCANIWLDRPVFRGVPLTWRAGSVTLEIQCGTRLTFGTKY